MRWPRMTHDQTSSLSRSRTGPVIVSDRIHPGVRIMHTAVMELGAHGRSLRSPE